MARNIDPKPETWIGEQVTWEKLAQNLPNKYLIYNHRTVYGFAFDFCVVAEGSSVYVIEVKGWTPNMIADVVSSNLILLTENDVEPSKQGSPLNQVVGYRNKMIDLLKDELHVKAYVLEFVCYPFISKEEYKRLKLNYVSEEFNTLFKEDLEDPDRLIQKFNDRYVHAKTNYPFLTAEGVARIRHHFEPNYNLKEEKAVVLQPYSRMYLKPSGLSDEEINEIINDYFKGVKTWLFITKQDLLIRVKEALDDRFKEFNLSYGKGNIAYGNATYSPSSIKDNSFDMFNFTAYVIETLSDITNQDYCIEDGERSEEHDRILRTLANQCSFNYEQYCVEHADAHKNILVMAGAGTGKTYSMVSRISFLCNRSIDPINNIIDDIAMMTFTNDAADNMKSRIKRMFMNYFTLTGDYKYLKFIEDTSQIHISTIHKFAIGILRNACMHQGIGYNFDITSEIYNRRRIYNEFLNHFIENETENNPNFIYQLGIPVYQLCELLMDFSDQMKNRNIDQTTIHPEMLGESPAIMNIFNDLIINVIIPAERQYADELRQINRLDLRDCMIRLNELLKATPILDHNFSFKYIFVDEFQDTDDVQIKIIQDLQKSFGEQCHLFIVGDLKQSIYRFRGATLSAFEAIKRGQGEWAEFYLNRNYRTDARLLDRFDSIFNKMNQMMLIPYEESDKLTSSIHKGYDDDKLIQKIEVHEKNNNDFYKSIFDVVEKEKNYIESLAKTETLSKEERTIALLVRDNRQVENLVTAAKKDNRGLVLEVSTGGDLYQLQPSLDLLKLTMALTHSESPAYLVSLLMSNYISAGKQIINVAGGTDAERLKNLRSMLDQFFTEKMNITWAQLLERFQTLPALTVLRDIYSAANPWSNFSSNKERQVFYCDNYECLIEDIQSHFRRDYLTINMINKYLSVNITTYQSEESRNIADSDNEIKIICSTIHKSKGLEYGTVILPYTNAVLDAEKITGTSVYLNGKNLAYSIRVNRNTGCNSFYEISGESMEARKEESRILYVAMTRAIRNLIWFDDLDRADRLTWGRLMKEGN